MFVKRRLSSSVFASCAIYLKDDTSLSLGESSMNILFSTSNVRERMSAAHFFGDYRESATIDSAHVVIAVQ